MPDNRFFNNPFNVALESQARSRTLRAIFEAIEQAAYDIQQELDGVTARGTNFENLANVPASLSGQALRYLRINAAASAIEFVSGSKVSLKSVADAAYTLQPVDAGQLLMTSNAAAVTVTIDTEANQEFEAGESVLVMQLGAGQVTFAPAAGVTIVSSDGILKTRKQYAHVALVYLGSDTWTLLGERDLPALSFASLVAPNSFTAAQAVTPVALVDGATINTNADLSNTFTVTIAGNRTLANPTNLRNGAIYTWRVRQDGTGGRTLAYGSKFRWPGGTVPTLSTTANAIDFISGQYFSDTDTILCNMLKGLA